VIVLNAISSNDILVASVVNKMSNKCGVQFRGDRRVTAALRFARDSDERLAFFDLIGGLGLVLSFVLGLANCVSNSSS